MKNNIKIESFNRLRKLNSVLMVFVVVVGSAFILAAIYGFVSGETYVSGKRTSGSVVTGARAFYISLHYFFFGAAFMLTVLSGKISPAALKVSFYLLMAASFLSLAKGCEADNPARKYAYKKSIFIEHLAKDRANEIMQYVSYGWSLNELIAQMHYKIAENSQLMSKYDEIINRNKHLGKVSNCNFSVSDKYQTFGLIPAEFISSNQLVYMSGICSFERGSSFVNLVFYQTEYTSLAYFDMNSKT